VIDDHDMVLLNKVVSKVNKAKCFSVLADETVNILEIEQVFLCITYFKQDSLKLTEEMENRFTNHHNILSSFHSLLIKNYHKEDFTNLLGRIDLEDIVYCEIIFKN
jgi:hypothetical protein